MIRDRYNAMTDWGLVPSTSFSLHSLSFQSWLFMSSYWRLQCSSSLLLILYQEQSANCHHLYVEFVASLVETFRDLCMCDGDVDFATRGTDSIGKGSWEIVPRHTSGILNSFAYEPLSAWVMNLALYRSSICRRNGTLSTAIVSRLSLHARYNQPWFGQMNHSRRAGMRAQGWSHYRR
jgi:hypothetical protein